MHFVVIISIILSCNNVFAVSDDLGIFLFNAKNNASYVNLPDTPKLESITNNYKKSQIRFFTKSKDSLINGVSQKSQDFNLNQLIVTGMMVYKKRNYAFIKTPYDTLMVNVGDRIKNAKIIKIESNIVELEDVQMQGNKVYKHKIYLKFNLKEDDSLTPKVS